MGSKQYLATLGIAYILSTQSVAAYKVLGSKPA